MPVKALFIGGTGVISTDCVRLAVRRGFDVTLLNRGNSPASSGARVIRCDISDEAAVAEKLKGRRFDVVADFIAFTPDQVERDIRLFSGRTDQFIFISSCSCYQKPGAHYLITESTPLRNPHWQYARDKIAGEELLMRAYRDHGFPATIVRPSHTYNEKKIPVGIHGKIGSWQIPQRILDGKPVLVHGDGLAWWTFTHARDFAVGFVGLMGNPHAVGEAFHIVSDEKVTWNMAYESIGRVLGREVAFCHVATDTLIKFDPSMEGNLLGDKAHSVIFDNSKIKRFVPDFNPVVRYDQGIRESIELALSDPKLRPLDPEFDAFCDRVAAAVAAL